MGSPLSFGGYIASTGPAYRLNAQVKIILACVFFISVFLVETWAGLGVLAGLLAAGFVVARVPLGKALTGLKPIVFILVMTVLVQALAFDGVSIVFSESGALKGLFLALRIALLFGGCALLTFTTHVRALADAIGSLLQPLRVVKAPVDDISTVVSMALAFVPTTAQEAARIVNAQKSRAADFEAGNALKRAHAWVPVLVPLCVRLFRRADQLGYAMDARCYRGEGRGHMRSVRPSAGEVAFLIAMVALVAAICVVM